MISFIIWDVSPSVFPGIEFLRWYGLCWALGVLVGYTMMQRIYKVEGQPTAELDNIAIYVMVAALLGARLGHILFYDPVYYWNNPAELLPFRLQPFEFTGISGLASHGGIAGAIIGLYIYTRKYQKHFLWLLDRLTIAAAALGGFIRFGNLLNSEIIGIPTDMPWAFIFTRVDQIPRHPAQLYESLFYFGISVVLFLVWSSKKYEKVNGFIFGLGVTLIFIQRFLVEFVKENQVAFEEGLVLNMGQTLSIPMILVGVLMMVWSLRKAKS